MTKEEAANKASLIAGPNAYAFDREVDGAGTDWKSMQRFYVGTSKLHGNGDSWEDALTNMKEHHED